MPYGVRKIIYIDTDASYASVEQRGDPELRGKPIIVAYAPRMVPRAKAAPYTPLPAA